MSQRSILWEHIIRQVKYYIKWNKIMICFLMNCSRTIFLSWLKLNRYKYSCWFIFPLFDFLYICNIIFKLICIHVNWIAISSLEDLISLNIFASIKKSVYTWIFQNLYQFLKDLYCCIFKCNSKENVQIGSNRKILSKFIEQSGLGRNRSPK